MTTSVMINRKRDIAYVRLSRPEKRNALNFQMMRGLADAAHSLRKDRSLRVVILHGEGQSFCSGLDFPHFTKEPVRIVQAFLKLGIRATNLFQETCWSWRRLPVPVIAVLHGHCFGGGLQLALAADFRYATPDCQLSVLEAKWGLIPDMSGSVTLQEVLPADQAKLLTMTGRIISGDEAKEIHLVTGVAKEPMAEAEALAKELLTRSPDSIAATKALFRRTRVADEAQAFRAERRLQSLVLLGKNQRIALKAALKKHLPQFGSRMPGF